MVHVVCVMCSDIVHLTLCRHATALLLLLAAAALVIFETAHPLHVLPPEVVALAPSTLPEHRTIGCDVWHV